MKRKETAEEQKPLHIFITLVLGVLLVFMGFLGIYMGIHYWVAATGSSLGYSIETTGFVNNTAEEPVVVYFPLPSIRQTPAFSQERYTQIFDGWTSRVAETPYGNMIAFTATKVPLQEIHAEFREDGIRYPDMILSGRVPGGYGSLSLLPAIESVPSPYSILEQGNELYEPVNGPASMVLLPGTFSGMEMLELHLNLRISTAPTPLDFFAGKWMVDTIQFHERIPQEHALGCIPITPLSLNAKQVSTEKLIQIAPPKGMYDFVLFRNGTCVPGHTAHYDYVVGNTTSEFFVALTWNDPQYPITMTLITPDGYVLGPYTDQYDLVADGKIPLNITAGQSLAGEWGIEIFGNAEPLHHQPYQIHVREY